MTKLEKFRIWWRKNPNQAVRLPADVWDQPLFPTYPYYARGAERWVVIYDVCIDGAWYYRVRKRDGTHEDVPEEGGLPERLFDAVSMALSDGYACLRLRDARERVAHFQAADAAAADLKEVE